MNRLVVLMILVTALFTFTCKKESDSKKKDDVPEVTQEMLNKITEENAEQEADKLLKEIDEL